MAPTTLMGQKTATSPDGRTRFMGQPMKMAELIAQLDGAGLRRARRALQRQAAQPGQEGDPQGAPAPGREQGLRVRRGARRVPDAPEDDARGDREVGRGADAPGLPARREEGRSSTRSRWFSLPKPSFEPERILEVVEASDERRRRASAPASRRTSPRTTSRSSSRARAATARRRPRCSSPTPASTRGSTRRTSRATARSRAAAPPTPTSTSPRAKSSPRPRRSPHVLIAFNAPSLAKFGPTVRAGRDDHLRQLGHHGLRRAAGRA